jgi:hypothetical protein
VETVEERLRGFTRAACRVVDRSHDGPDERPPLGQLRYFTAVAEPESFMRRRGTACRPASGKPADQGTGQTLGVSLLRGGGQRVTLTPEGAVFLADCRRVLGDADGAWLRVRAAATGEAGTLRLVYSLVSAFENVPTLLAAWPRTIRCARQAREVFGSEVADLLLSRRCDVALAPLTSRPPPLRHQTIHREAVRLEVAEDHPLGALRPHRACGPARRAL